MNNTALGAENKKEHYINGTKKVSVYVMFFFGGGR